MGNIGFLTCCCCRIEHKEKLAASTKLEQYLKRYERECEKTAALERENAFLMDQVSNMKDETEVCGGGSLWPVLRRCAVI